MTPQHGLCPQLVGQPQAGWHRGTQEATLRELRPRNRWEGPVSAWSSSRPHSLPKAADALKLFLPFQKPSGFYKYHFGSEYSGGFCEV